MATLANRQRRLCVALSLNRVDQRRQALDPHFQPVARSDGSHAAGGAGDDDVSGQEGHVGGDEADQVRAIENELAGVGILPELPVLKQLDAQILRVQFGLNVRPQGRKGVE